MTLERRLADLKNEHAKGRAVLADFQAQRRHLDAQEQALTLTLARIEGAIQFAMELCAEPPAPLVPGDPQDPPAPKGDPQPADPPATPADPAPVP